MLSAVRMKKARGVGNAFTGLGILAPAISVKAFEIRRPRLSCDALQRNNLILTATPTMTSMTEAIHCIHVLKLRLEAI